MDKRGLLIVAMLLLAAACGNDGDGDPQAAPTADATEAATTPAPTPCSLEDASTDERTSGEASEVAHLTDVRPNDGGGCPRVVFEFRDQEPGYTIRYVEGPFNECGSGDDVPTQSWEAGAFLSVRFEPARSADLEQESAPPTYDGPRDISIEGDILKHMKVICDFEAVMEWVIGVDERRSFTVGALDDPSRIVIDWSEG